MKNNYFDCFLFTNNRGCDLIKKKTGIIKPEGEIVKERLFITPEYTTAKEIKKIRKELHLTQKEFAAYMNVSQGMVSRWESREYNFTIKTLNEICQKLNLHLQLDLTPIIGKQNYTVLKWNSESTQNNKQNNWVKYIKDKEAIA